jgi:hypothetical protein
VDRFHENGIKVGLQTYCFFLSRSSSYVTPVPHKDLDVLRSFTLKGDISEEVTSLSVEEDTEGITAEEGFIYVNSPFLWIDDELIRFSVAENGVFTVAERGALGTRPASHKSGSAVKHLKQYFLLPLAKAGSELFYEVARKTAEFFDATGATASTLMRLTELLFLTVRITCGITQWISSRKCSRILSTR